MAKQLVQCCCGVTDKQDYGPAFGDGPKDSLRWIRQEPVIGGVGGHDLRCGKFSLSSSISHHRCASSAPVLTTVPSKIHHHFQSRVLYSPFLASVSLLSSYVLSSFVIEMLYKSFTASIFPLALTYSVNPKLFRQTEAANLRLISQTSIREYIIHTHFCYW